MDRAPLTPDEFAAAVGAITSAFGDPTRRDIYLFARDSEVGVTAAEVARHFDLHPNVARHHLDKLADNGYLDVAVGRTGRAGAGRPSKQYRTTTKDVSLEFPVRHDDLLVTLLAKALQLIPDDQAQAMAEDVGTHYGRIMAAATGEAAADGPAATTFRDALHTVAEALTAHGFAAHAEKHHDELRIVAEHCPFGDAAIENPVICAVDRGMVKGMLSVLYGDTTTEIAASLPQGDAHCVTAVERTPIPPVASIVGTSGRPGRS